MAENLPAIGINSPMRTGVNNWLQNRRDQHSALSISFPKTQRWMWSIGNVGSTHSTSPTMKFWHLSFTNFHVIWKNSHIYHSWYPSWKLHLSLFKMANDSWDSRWMHKEHPSNKWPELLIRKLPKKIKSAHLQ